LAQALDPLGQAVYYTGHVAEAEAIYLREIDVHRQSGHALGAVEAMPFQYLGELRHDQGRDAEALPYFREALRISRKYLPPDHPYLLDAEYDVAASLEYNHQAAAAEPTFRELLASYERILGPGHKDTLMAQQGLAHNLLAQQRYAEAAVVALPAAQGLSRLIGDENSWTEVAWGVYGLAACRSGQGEAGLAVLQRVAIARRKTFAESDWHIPSTNVQIGTCLVVLKRYAEAEPLLLDAKSKDKWAGRIEAAYEALRDLCAATGRPAEAAEWQSKIIVASR
jgi:eukaryotic-like serine/threonine-protein kinase